MHSTAAYRMTMDGNLYWVGIIWNVLLDGDGSISLSIYNQNPTKHNQNKAKIPPIISSSFAPERTPANSRKVGKC